MQGYVRIRRSRRKVARGAVLFTTAAVAAATLALGTGHLWASLPHSEDVPSATERLASVEQPQVLNASFAAASVAHLTEMFHRLGYDLATVRSDLKVPRVFLGSLPPDLSDTMVIQTRKRVFLKAVLPLVLHVNEVIRGDRNRAYGDVVRVMGRINAAGFRQLALVTESELQ